MILSTLNNVSMSTMVGISLFTMSAYYLKQIGIAPFFNVYIYLHEQLKKYRRGSDKEYVPCLSFIENSESDHHMSIWSLNVDYVELSEFRDVNMTEIIVHGIRKFKMAFDKTGTNTGKKMTMNLWTIAHEHYKQIYPNKTFPEKIIIHLLPETLLFSKLPINYDTLNFTITLDKNIDNVILHP